jgi:zinc transport system ATP-binding protein
LAEPAVRTHNLNVRLGAGTILHNIDLTVAEGEAVALLGANGSGKSTLVKTLVGIVPAAAGGRAEIFGVDTASRRARKMRSDVGYVPQRVGFSSGVPATALEVVMSGLLAQRRLRPGRAGRQQALDALDRVGLGDRAQESVQLFSGGQQQRVLIARSLVRRPRMLILDEPLAGIDRTSRQALGSTLAELRSSGTTILVVLHELGELAAILNRAVVLRHGRIVYDGDPPIAAPGHDHPAHDHVHPHEDAPAAPHTVPDLRAEW